MILLQNERENSPVPHCIKSLLLVTDIILREVYILLTKKGSGKRTVVILSDVWILLTSKGGGKRMSHGINA